MLSTAIFFAVIKVVITIALATLFFQSGYRFGYRDATAGRQPRIRVFSLDEDDDQYQHDPETCVAGLLPAIGQTYREEVSAMGAPAADPFSHTIEGTITNLSVCRTRNGQSVAVFELADGSESTMCVVFPKLFSASCDLLAEGAPVRVSGGLETARGRTQLVCRRIDRLA